MSSRDKVKSQQEQARVYMVKPAIGKQMLSTFSLFYGWSETAQW